MKGRSLGAHWSKREDLDLCVGTYRHGFGKFEEMLADPTLCFKGKWNIDRFNKQDMVFKSILIYAMYYSPSSSFAFA